MTTLYFFQWMSPFNWRWSLCRRWFCQYYITSRVWVTFVYNSEVVAVIFEECIYIITPINFEDILVLCYYNCFFFEWRKFDLFPPVQEGEEHLHVNPILKFWVAEGHKKFQRVHKQIFFSWVSRRKERLQTFLGEFFSQK